METERRQLSKTVLREKAEKAGTALGHEWIIARREAGYALEQRAVGSTITTLKDGMTARELEHYLDGVLHANWMLVGSGS